MFERTISLLIFAVTASAMLAACNLGSEHCIGDCESLTGGAQTAEPAATTAESTSTAAEGTSTGDEAPTTTAATGGTTTGVETSTAGSDTQPSYTCRDAVACLVLCELSIPKPTPPNYDWAGCFFTCLEDLPDAEWDKLDDLRGCVYQKCAMTTGCMEHDEELCENCRLISLGTPVPEPGDPCEAEMTACE